MLMGGWRRSGGGTAAHPHEHSHVRGVHSCVASPPIRLTARLWVACLLSTQHKPVLLMQPGYGGLLATSSHQPLTVCIVDRLHHLLQREQRVRQLLGCGRGVGERGDGLLRGGGQCDGVRDRARARARDCALQQI